MKKYFIFAVAALALSLTACGDKNEPSSENVNKESNTEQDSDSGEQENHPLVVPEGAICGVFSVSDTKKVFFSKGNLQVKPNTKTWRFAEHQYDTIGVGNITNSSSSSNGWIDLFSWGTSGYKNYPWGKMKDSNYYGDGAKDIAGTNYDWGVYNKISNGGDETGLWRTLTRAEWVYVIEKHKHSRAIVNGVRGLVILPDNWILSDDLPFEITPDANPSSNSSVWYKNDFDFNEWQGYENAGALFLPAAGIINDIYGLIHVGESGIYWSATSESNSEYRAWHIRFDKNSVIGIDARGYSRQYRLSVRLVRDVE